MKNKRPVYVALILFFCVQVTACAKGNDCQLDNDALKAMSKSLVTFTRSDGSTFDIEVKTATSNATRGAGFQRVCASTIAAEPILFIFPREFKPRFHMNNVVAPIDIAFFTSKGEIDSIQKMEPYVLVSLKKPLYSPSSPVIGALEGHKGFFEEHKIDSKSLLSWKPLNAEKE